MKTKPITPEFAKENKINVIPDEVIYCINQIIQEKFDGKRAFFTLDDLVAKIKNKMDLDNADIIFQNHWLDFEDIYRDAGWIVKYEKSGYCESSPDTFEFKIK